MSDLQYVSMGFTLAPAAPLVMVNQQDCASHELQERPNNQILEMVRKTRTTLYLCSINYKAATVFKRSTGVLV